MSKKGAGVGRVAYLLLAPLIVAPTTESSIAPHVKYGDLLIHRIAEVDWERGLASKYEAMLYILSASLTTPPAEDYYRILLNLFPKYYPESVGPLELNDSDLAELSEYHKQILDDLRGWIFKKQMRRVKEILKSMDYGIDASPKDMGEIAV